jgi:hypothetical protein
MIFTETECPDCDGHRRIHTPGCNGDPDDNGIVCSRCEGSGVIAVDVETGDGVLA